MTKLEIRIFAIIIIVIAVIETYTKRHSNPSILCTFYCVHYINTRYKSFLFVIINFIIITILLMLIGIFSMPHYILATSSSSNMPFGIFITRGGPWAIWSNFADKILIFSYLELEHLF